MNVYSQKRGAMASAEHIKSTETYFESLFADDQNMPFSFTYDGKVYHGFDAYFEVTRQGDSIIATHLLDGLRVTVERASEPEYCEHEWTIWFENTSEENSALLSDIHAIDLNFTGSFPRLHYMTGERFTSYDSFRRCEADLYTGVSMNVYSMEGRPTVTLPYFRLDYGDGGCIIAVSWHGQWDASFDVSTSEQGDQTQVRAKQSNFSSYLKPGEKVRSPLVALIPYENREYYHSVNCWRRFLTDCTLRRIDGNLPEPLYVVSGFGPGSGAAFDEELALSRVRKYKEYGLKNMLFWQDAGWYPLNDTTDVKEWGQVGTWTPSPWRFPNGFKNISDQVHALGGKVNLWFELERAVRGSQVAEQTDYCYPTPPGQTNRLVDFSRDDVIEWAIELKERIMRENDIDIYREDFNMDPIPHLVYADSLEGDNRNGINENKFVQGKHRYYQEFCRRNPQMALDICAGGGRRMELEMLRYTSYAPTTPETDRGNPTVMQQLQASIPEWFCTFGSSGGKDLYEACSVTAQMFAISLDDLSGPIENTECERRLQLSQRIAPLYYGDFYALCSPTPSVQEWAGWQYHDTASGESIVQLFRREEAPDTQRKFALYGLNPDQRYRVTELCYGETFTALGRDLDGSNDSLTVTISNPRDCRAYLIEEVK